ncbi:MAG TPA: S41 family peptidase [Tenuifilum sp.]|nr:S41 family peptidase [Tenuifilum sp.]
MNRFKLAILLLFGLAAFTSCEDDEQKVNVNKEVYNLMKDWYYWYDQLPNVDPNSYPDPVELVKAIRVNPPDRWSYVTTKQELDAYYKQAAYIGFGFGSAFTADNKLIITFVFNTSPLYANGIGRGWEIVSIDGQTPTPDNYTSPIGPSEVGVTKTFVFKSPSGQTTQHTFSKAQIEMNTVLLDSVYTINGKKVGYFVLKGFIEKTNDELNAVFQKFKSAGVSELVCDLRYNGGGQVNVSQFLGNLIGGSIAFGRVFGQYIHNDKHSDKNSHLYFSTTQNSLELQRAIFITTSITASASELVINALKPFMDVVLVGSKTHGKPVGMYTFEFKDPSIDWAIVPVCFSIRNANNDGDYYDGIPVTIEAADDVLTPLGEVTESSLNASLNYLGLGTKVVTKRYVTAQPITGKGLYEEIGAW